MPYCIISNGLSLKSKSLLDASSPSCIHHINQPNTIVISNRYRVDGDKAGWNSKDPEARAAYQALNKKGIFKFLERQVLVIGSTWLFTFLFRKYLTGWFDASHVASSIASTPTWWESSLHLAIGLILFETNFYWCHVLQHRYWYASHKIHHMYKAPNVLTASWGSSFDGIASEIIPHALIPAVLGFHMYTTWMVLPSLSLLPLPSHHPPPPFFV
jgi:sterol desaturase/sphingolipid hydroxylase (fatty acid hydroxylase superfamily)